MEKSAHLVLVFVGRTEAEARQPNEKKHAARLLTQAQSVMAALTHATGAAPGPVHPDLSKLCFLVEGAYEDIVNCLSLVCHNDTRWLVTTIAQPAAAFGLSSAEAWIQRRASN